MLDKKDNQRVLSCYFSMKNPLIIYNFYTTMTVMFQCVKNTF